MSYFGGMLENAVTEIRDTLDVPSNSTKLPTANILRRLSDSWCQIFRDLQMASEREIYLTFTYSLTGVGADARLPIPATCTRIIAVELLNSDGTAITPVLPRRPTDESVYNYGYDLIGSYLRLVRPSSDAWSQLRIKYEPGAFAPVHYGVIDTGQVDTTVTPNTVQPNQASGQVGLQDYRVNGYIGMWFRVYQTTSAPTGYTNTTYNMAETPISDFSETNQKCSLQDALPFTTGFTWKYEIVPTVDMTLWRAVVLLACRTQANLWRRPRQAQGINAEYQSMLRSLRAMYATADATHPPRYWRKTSRYTLRR